MKFIFTLLSIVFFLSSCAPHTTVPKHYRYHKQNQQGPDFPDIWVSVDDCE